MLEHIVCITAGDAKCVLGRMDEGGAQLRAITLTKDHKALYPEERARIEKAGGFVDRQGRLGGRIEVARAFGDAQFKPVGLSAVPDVKVTQDGLAPTP